MTTTEVAPILTAEDVLRQALHWQQGGLECCIQERDRLLDELRSAEESIERVRALCLSIEEALGNTA